MLAIRCCSKGSPVFRFLELCKQRRLHIVVVGDTLVDERFDGEVSRISPEAPVPIFKTDGITPRVTRGGAANVQKQLQWLNVDATLLSSRNVPPVKRRYFANKRQVMRHDIEPAAMGHSDKSRKELFSRFCLSLESGQDAVILSDYGKGTLDAALIRQIIGLCRERGVPTIVDPKNRAASEWWGCTVLKPNEREAEQLTGAADGERQAWWLREHTGAAVVITRSERAPLVLGDDGYTELPDTRGVCFRSAVGAGDCFAAFLATGIVHGFCAVDAAALAHEAGQAFVEHDDGAAVLPHELLRRVDPAGAKIVEVGELRQILDARHGGQRVVFSGGTFRFLHAGHCEMLQWAREQGGVLIIGLNSDASVQRLKPGKVCLPWAERARLLASLEAVDFVVRFDEDTPAKICATLRPSVLAKGPDCAEKLLAEAVDAQVLIAPQGGFLRHASEIETEFAVPTS
jgi:D-beta-D-heptose 7-phosphate kinase / D-beta-D-heptose 1-phosphate adenosyltransferase